MIYFISGLVRRLRAKVNSLKYFKRDYMYDIGGGVMIKLDSGHALPTYKEKHINYDRFLPHLVSCINDEDSIVVDIGANYGDTMAALAISNSNLTYICIEADIDFYDYLLHNVKCVKSSIPSLTVLPFLAFLGKNIFPTKMEGKSGTKHAVVSDTNTNERARIPVMTLSRIIASLHIHPDSVIRLLKTDTDGYDYDAIDASQHEIKRFNPILYFECFFDSDKQLKGYQETLTWLSALDYVNGVVFDNFGGIILRSHGTNLLPDIFSLIDYLNKQNKKLTSRTIYYYDICLFTEADHSLVDQAIATYYK